MPLRRARRDQRQWAGFWLSLFSDLREFRAETSTDFAEAAIRRGLRPWPRNRWPMLHEWPFREWLYDFPHIGVGVGDFLAVRRRCRARQRRDRSRDGLGYVHAIRFLTPLRPSFVIVPEMGCSMPRPCKNNFARCLCNEAVAGRQSDPCAVQCPGGMWG